MPLFRYYKLHVGHQIINIKLMLENHTPLFAQFSYGDRKKIQSPLNHINHSYKKAAIV